ncbi:MAG: aldo/keto reductase [Cyclobacteriaceae bacterium]
MKYNFLGNTGIKVSELCMGTMSFGGIADEANSRAMFNASRDAGINFYDCADVYEKGISEEYLGKFIQEEKCRDEIVITTKVYGRTGAGENALGSSRYHITRAVESSLKRLNTDYIDIYFLHRFDEKTNMEETLRVLDDLVSQGKILYLGASNFAAWQVSKALGISDNRGWSKISCIQPMYNLVKRQAEVEILPMAMAENIGVINYSPLGGGLLTGKYNQSKTAGTGRLTDNPMYNLRYGDSWMYEVAAKFTELANEVNVHPVSLAIAWTAAHPAITAPIIGARNLDQLKPSLEAAEVDMTDELWQKISSLSYEPPSATDRSESKADPKYGKR